MVRFSIHKLPVTSHNVVLYNSKYSNCGIDFQKISHLNKFITVFSVNKLLSLFEMTQAKVNRTRKFWNRKFKCPYKYSQEESSQTRLRVTNRIPELEWVRTMPMIQFGPIAKKKQMSKLRKVTKRTDFIDFIHLENVAVSKWRKNWEHDCWFHRVYSYSTGNSEFICLNHEKRRLLVLFSTNSTNRSALNNSTFTILSVHGREYLPAINNQNVGQAGQAERTHSQCNSTSKPSESQKKTLQNRVVCTKSIQFSI